MISMTKEDWLQGLSVNSDMPSKHTMPILENVQIKTISGKVEFRRTDISVERIESVMPLTADDLSVTVPANIISSAIRSYPANSTVSLDVFGGQAELRSGRSKIKLSTLPVQDYPSLDDIEFESSFTMPGVDLKSALDAVKHSMANQDVRYYLNGARLDLNGTLSCVATDGARLSLCIIPGEYPEAGVIIPNSSVLKIIKMIGCDDVVVSIGRNHIRIKDGDSVFTSKLIDGRYPDYKRAIPESGKKALVDTADFRTMLSRAAIISEHKFEGKVDKRVKIELLKFSENAVSVSANGHGNGNEATEFIDAEYADSDLLIGFNARFLLDAVSSIKGSKTLLEINDAFTPVRITDPTDDSTLHLVTPVRI